MSASKKRKSGVAGFSAGVGSSPKPPIFAGLRLFLSSSMHHTQVMKERVEITVAQ